MPLFTAQARALAGALEASARGGASADDIACCLTELTARRGEGVSNLTGCVREVILVLSSSRGGSTMLSELLRNSDGLLHLRGEVTPFLRLVGLSYPLSGPSDALDASHLAGLSPELRSILDQELALDVGSRATDERDEHLVEDIAWRWAIQWPDSGMKAEQWVDLATRALAMSSSDLSGRLDGRGLGRQLIVAARSLVDGAGPVLDPAFYDLPPWTTNGAAEAPAVFSPSLLLEEPPFVLPVPWRRAMADQVARLPLIVKSPSSAYRLPFLRALFPNARIRTIHLTRNPAASINGLYDGWRHRGFHSHDLGSDLHLTDYVDRDGTPSSWWKFDLAPGWEEVSKTSLLEVCAFQWRTAHRWILDGDLDGQDYLRVRFEDLMRAETRVSTVEAIAAWMEIPAGGPLLEAAGPGSIPSRPPCRPRAADGASGWMRSTK